MLEEMVEHRVRVFRWIQIRTDCRISGFPDFWIFLARGRSPKEVGGGEKKKKKAFFLGTMERLNQIQLQILNSKNWVKQKNQTEFE